MKKVPKISVLEEERYGEGMRQWWETVVRIKGEQIASISGLDAEDLRPLVRKVYKIGFKDGFESQEKRR